MAQATATRYYDAYNVSNQQAGILLREFLGGRRLYTSFEPIRRSEVVDFASISFSLSMFSHYIGKVWESGVGVQRIWVRRHQPDYSRFCGEGMLACWSRSAYQLSYLRRRRPGFVGRGSRLRADGGYGIAGAGGSIGMIGICLVVKLRLPLSPGIGLHHH